MWGTWTTHLWSKKSLKLNCENPTRPWKRNVQVVPITTEDHQWHYTCYISSHVQNCENALKQSTALAWTLSANMFIEWWKICIKINYNEKKNLSQNMNRPHKFVLNYLCDQSNPFIWKKKSSNWTVLLIIFLHQME